MVGYFKRSFQGLPKNVWSLAVVMLINRSGMMVVPFLSLYMLDVLGWSKTQAGIGTSVYGLAGLLGAFAGAWLCDIYGTYKVLMVSLIVAGFSFFAYPLITEFYALISWIFVTVCIADMMRPAIFTAISDYSDKDNVARGISLIRMAINLGIAIGPAVGGFLAFHYGYNWLFIVDGITCLIAAVALYLLVEDKPIIKVNDKLKKTKQSPYTDKSFLLFMALNLIVLTAFFQILYTTPVYLKEVLGIQENLIGWFFTANGLMIFLFEMPIIFYLEKKSHFPPLVIGGFMIGLSYLIFPLCPYVLPAIILHSLLIGFGEIMNFPFISTIGLGRAGEANKAQYMGAVSVVFSLGLIVASVVGLPLVELIGFELFYYIMGGIACIASLLLWLIRHRVSKSVLDF